MPNGDKYEGQFKDDKPIGKHLWTYTNGTKKLRKRKYGQWFDAKGV